MHDLSEFEPRKLRWKESLLPLKEPIVGLWKLDSTDFELAKTHLFVMFICWLIPCFGGSFLSPFAYWDGPNYVYAARTMYKITRDNPWTKTFGYQPSYFACHLPGFPLVIRFFSLITFNCYWLGDLLAIITCSLGCIYVFRRLLIVYGVVSSPAWTSTLFLFIPVRFLIYKVVGASEPLFCMMCYLSLIFYKTGQKYAMLLAMTYACITRIEGLSIVGTIGLCYLLRFDIGMALFTSLSLIAPAGLLWFHKYRFGDYLAYFRFNQQGQKLIKFPPMFRILNAHRNLGEAEFTITFQLVFLAGVVVLYDISLPIAIFSSVYLLYNTVLNHIDIYRYALPGYTLAVLIGFDSIWNHSAVKKNMVLCGGIYCVLVLMYVFFNISSNRSSDSFLLNVMDPQRWPNL